MAYNIRNVKINRTDRLYTQSRYGISFQDLTRYQKRLLIENPIVKDRSLDDNFLSDDTYLRDCSKDIIEKSKKMFVRPFIELYPKSSWLYLKNNDKDKYTEFCNYNKNNQILTHEQIYEINIFLKLKHLLITSSVGNANQMNVHIIKCKLEVRMNL